MGDQVNGCIFFYCKSTVHSEGIFLLLKGLQQCQYWYKTQTIQEVNVYHYDENFGGTETKEEYKCHGTRIDHYNKTIKIASFPEEGIAAGSYAFPFSFM